MPERLFYDGSCGLCHRAVRFVLAEDRTGAAFRVAGAPSRPLRRIALQAASATSCYHRDVSDRRCCECCHL